MKKLIGLTGPSAFSGKCSTMIEKNFGCNFVQLAHEDKDNLNYWLSQVQGVVLAGGTDIHPSVYGSNVMNKSNLTKFDIKRDQRELLIIDHCIDNKIPLLAICRGHQLLSIALGLHREFVIDLCETTTVHQPTKVAGLTIAEEEPCHQIDIIAPDIFKMESVPERKVFEDVLGEDHTKIAWVNSYHHQGVFFFPKKEAHYTEKGIKVLCTSSAEWNKKHNLIELMVDTNHNWVSCQWHPEADYETNTPSRTVLEMFKSMINKEK